MTTSINHTVSLNITGIDSAYFYPTVYFNQHQDSDEISDFKDLFFPTIQDYSLKFGDQLSDVYSNTVSF